MRSPAEMDIVQIDVSNRCHLACTACTRLIAHQPKKWDMDLDTFEKAVQSMEGWYQPGKVLGVIAGEPTLHPQFEQLSRKFQELWGPKEDTGNGIAPVADRNAYATERLFDRTNGRGLWTSLGKRYYEHYETIQDVYSHHNQNTHEAGGKHQANLIDRKTLCEALGISDDEWKQLRWDCPIQNQWSATITPFGAYFCEAAAHIDILLNDGKRAWPIEPGWWKRTPEEFGEQLDICEHCSLCLPAPSRVDSAERDIISEPNRIALEMAGSPAVKKGNFDIYDPKMHLEQRDIHDRKDHYVGESGCRVSPDNRSMMPRKLSAVVVCVGRNVHLGASILHNARQVDELVVVTGTQDTRTIETVHGANRIVEGKIKLVESDRYQDRDFAFNKGAMLNDGLRALAPVADWVVLTDADVFLPGNLREYVRTHALNPGVLHGAYRDNGTPGIRDANDQPNGFFQLFNRRASSIRDRWPAVVSEEFSSAGSVDTWLMQQFPAGKRHMVPDLVCRHIPHDEAWGQNWNGERLGPCWRQVAMLTHQGWAWHTKIEFSGERHLRMVSTRDATCVEMVITDGKFPSELLDATEAGFVLGGKPVGWEHIHVAAWCE